MKKIIHKLVLSVTLLLGVVNIVIADGTPDPMPQKYAFIINGGGNAAKNYIRYWYDCSVVYQTLLSKGYDPNHIYVLMADGTINNYNRLFAACHNISLDLDDDGINDIRYPATFRNVEGTLNELSSRMSSEDDLFIYVTGPGNSDDFGQSGIELWGGDTLRGNILAYFLESLTYRTINVVMQQSYAGGFINDLIGLDNIVITTACNATEYTYAMNRSIFDEFTYRWVSAITGSSPYSMIPCDVCTITDPYHFSDLTDCFIANDGDYNGDGFVTMKEAFNYAEHYVQTLDHPQIASNLTCLSHVLALDELLYSLNCDNALIGDWDLYMKDNGLDIGEEPNTTTEESWISNAIWCEQNGQRVDILQSGATYDVCVRIENRGNAPSPDSVKLYTHWTKATIGGTWPWGWYGENTYDCNGFMVPRGGLIDTVYLPSIGPGETYTAMVPWTTPNVGTYLPCLNFAEDLSQLWHYCLLARIVDDQEQPDETIVDMGLKEFVLNYNNVVSRNVTIMYFQPENHLNSQLTGVVALANPIEGDNSSFYSLRCKIIGQDGWENFASVSLTFDPEFYNSQPFISWHNCDAFGEGTFELYDDALFENIQFTPENGLFPLKLDVTYFNTYALGDYPGFRIYLELQDVQEQPVGGERFYFNVGQQCLANNIARRYIFDENTNTEIVQKQIDVEDILNVYIYNVQGQLIIKSTSDKIESLHLQQGIYILRYVGDKMSYSVKIIK